MERVSRCRVCGGLFFSQPLLQLHNMPNAAQFMPDASTLSQDVGTDLRVCHCSACGLIQLDTLPVAYYREVVRAAAYSPEMGDYRLAQFTGFAKRFGLIGQKVLEVGCGRGEYLTLLNQSGMEAHGLEYGAESVSHCQSIQQRVCQGFIETADHQLASAPFQAFFILNFLEHLPQPHETLRGVANNLSEGAVGLVEVPNFDMILRNRLFSEFINDHLFYFNRESLSQLLALSGFEVVECTETWHDYILSATVRKRAPADLSALVDFQAKIDREIHHYLDTLKGQRVAIWGAGHQALAVISLLGLQSRVDYVVDSAPFKQGKFTPASHLPIVPPAHLKTDPVDGVLVMAASYSDEVARIIRSQYDPKLSVAILRDSGLEIV
ncbi:MAG: methyltransferase domain-containing protein [Magnetococcales bacterium]|nr:methyltransferase domain-containing protein [Magnetococcales bacterium]